MSQQINLFNPLFTTKKARFSSGDMLKGVGLVFAGCTLLAAYLYYQVDVLTEEAAGANSLLVTSSMQLQKVKVQHAPKGKSQELEAQVQQSEQEILALRQVLDVLKKGNIGNTDGYSAYMRALARQSMDGLWLTGFNIVGAGNQVELEGKAIKPELLPLYINRLKNEPILQGKSFGTLEMMTPEATTEPVVKTERTNSPEQSKAPSYIGFKLN